MKTRKSNPNAQNFFAFFEKYFARWELQITSSLIGGQIVSSKNHGQCLTEDTLTEYLEGTLEPAIKAASEEHLLTCDECRIRLGSFMRILNDNLTPQEANALELFMDRKKDRGQEKMQRRVAVPRLFLALAAGVILMGVVSARFLLERSAEPQSAREVVQLLLAKHRPFESQISGEPHLPILQTRGPDDPGISYDLLAAEMTRLSANSHEMGRFYLLQKDFARAIPYLEIAEREVGAGAAVHNDLGVAYLESGNPALFEKAGDEFTHALESDRSFTAAAFNLGIFYERSGAVANAEAEWKTYLGMDSESDWAAEARKRLQGLSR
jgi:hypothetical protein